MTSGLSTLATLAGAIAIVWVIATVVRRHRPDAYRPLLWWAIGSLVTFLVTAAAYPLAPVFFYRSGGSTDGYLMVLSVIRVVSTAVHLGLVVMLVRGLVALAQPPKPVVVESDAPYR